MLTGRRRFLLPLGLAVIFLLFYSSWKFHGPAIGPGFMSGHHSSPHGPPFGPKVIDDPEYFWRRLPTRYPVASPRPLPTQRPKSLPKIQTAFGKEKAQDRETRLERQAAVKAAFERCWASYRDLASPADELTPISGEVRNTFGGWGATLVDSLDTLWIMGLRDEFAEAAALAARIDFTPSVAAAAKLPDQVNVFETTIRYLGGFLAAYDLSGDQRLLRKAREVGDMLLAAFDTPNRMPITRWDVGAAARGDDQVAPGWALIAEVGSLCMEFTRLSLITGDPRWFDATERIREVLEDQQEKTKLPGMWPISVNLRDEEFGTDTTFGLGAMADSVFEYLPKMTALLGGLVPSYEKMYTRAMDTAMKYNLFRPMTPDNADILISGTVYMKEATNGDGTRRPVPQLEPMGQHLVCFAGGMFTVGGRLTRNKEHMEAARRLTEGCIWAYHNMPKGIMPESYSMIPCESSSSLSSSSLTTRSISSSSSSSSSSNNNDRECPWDELAWKKAVLEQAGEDEQLDTTETAERRADKIIAARRIPKGFASIPDARYILRPEAIESVFLLYRATGRRDLPEAAWAMFEAIERQTKTELANSALGDVTVEGGRKTDSMESFWLGETLKYFYLIFSEPDLVSLDEWVFNTEAHPFRRLVP